MISALFSLTVALGSWSLSPIPVLFGYKGLKASDTFTLPFKKWAGLSAEFSLSSCSANFHFLKVVIQRILASQMSHSTFLQPSFIAWHVHSARKLNSHYLYFLLSVSPALHPLPLQVVLFLALSLAALREEKQYISNILSADAWTGLRSLIAAQWRKWHQL